MTLALEHGFVADSVAVVSEQDILGERIARPRKRKRKAENFLTEVSSLHEGDLVVHVDHGIGRYDGLINMDVGGAPHDMLKVTYAGGDRLFVPVENIEVLSRYGSEEEPASSSTSWGRATGRRARPGQGAGQGDRRRADQDRRRPAAQADGAAAAAPGVRRVLRPLPLRRDRRPA